MKDGGKILDNLVCAEEKLNTIQELTLAKFGITSTFKSYDRIDFRKILP